MAGLDLFKLDGRAAIVTGGSKGLGESMAAALASAGADLVLTSRHRDEVEATAKKIAGETGRTVVGIEADVTQPDAVERVVGETISRFGKIDILINNAGINIRGPIEELTQEQFE